MKRMIAIICLIGSLLCTAGLRPVWTDGTNLYVTSGTITQSMVSTEYTPVTVMPNLTVSGGLSPDVTGVYYWKSSISSYVRMADSNTQIAQIGTNKVLMSNVLGMFPEWYSYNNTGSWAAVYTPSGGATGVATSKYVQVVIDYPTVITQYQAIVSFGAIYGTSLRVSGNTQSGMLILTNLPTVTNNLATGAVYRASSNLFIHGY